MKLLVCSFVACAGLSWSQPAPAPAPVPAAAPVVAAAPAPPAPPDPVLAPEPPRPAKPPRGFIDVDGVMESIRKIKPYIESGALKELSGLGPPYKSWTDSAFFYQGSPGGPAKSRADEQAERSYERGKRALDKRQWDEAVAQFDEAASASKTVADAALYFKAYALMKLGRSRDATAALELLARNHPQSRWLNDAKALQLEIAQAAGRPVSPESAADDDLKLMAINGLIQSDPDRALPLLEKLLTTQSSPKLRERALFVLSQNGSAKARETLARIAKGGANPELQLQAIRALGIHGSSEGKQVLAEVYASTTDLALKRQILNSYMASGDRDRILNAAKSDPSPELRMAAIKYLGSMGANTQLAAMYASEQSEPIRAQLIQAMYAAGNSQKLIEIAKTEKNAALRERAIRHLGSMDAATTGPALVELYDANSELEIRKRIMQALYVQNNAKSLVAVARKETNPELKRTAVQQLSNMRSKEATDYLLEILNK